MNKIEQNPGTESGDREFVEFPKTPTDYIEMYTDILNAIKGERYWRHEEQLLQLLSEREYPSERYILTLQKLGKNFALLASDEDYTMSDEFVERIVKALKITTTNASSRESIQGMIDEWTLFAGLEYEKLTVVEAYEIETLECTLMLGYYQDKNDETAIG